MEEYCTCPRELTSSLSADEFSNSVQDITGDEIIPEVPFNSKISWLS